MTPISTRRSCGEFWHLVAPEGGRIGVVLPRSALAAKGSTAFRKELLNSAEVVDLTMLVNNREWVFPQRASAIHDRAHGDHPPGGW